MTDTNLQKAVKDSTVKTSALKATINDPALRGKLRMDTALPTDGSIYWYIKFNVQLDPETVNKANTNVMETNGYILDADISYDPERGAITIHPIDAYIEGEFYVLTITKRVLSAKGMRMKNEVNILFKIIESRISEFKILKDSVKLPKPKQKPAKLKQAAAEALRARYPEQTYADQTTAYTYHDEDGEQETPTATSTERLPHASLKINFWLGLAGVALSVFSVYTGVFAFYIFSFMVAGAGIIHITVQLCQAKRRSLINYIFGASLFYKKKYVRAKRRFDRAAALDPHNELAEFALRKIQRYM